MSEKRVIVHRNEANAEGKLLIVGSNMDLKQFLKAANKKLGIRAKKVYLSTGVQVEQVWEMQNNDLLYLSQGEEFYKIASATNREEKVTVSVLGTGGVGKSALTLRFNRDMFVEEWDPTIEDAYRKTIEVDDKLCNIEILDTAGQDVSAFCFFLRFSSLSFDLAIVMTMILTFDNDFQFAQTSQDFISLRPQWMVEKDGYIFVYNMMSPHSLEELTPFYELHKQMNEDRKVPIILVANKKDLADKDMNAERVSREAGEAQAKQWGAHYIETSACTGENVELTFKELVRHVRAGQKSRPHPRTAFA